MIKADGKQINKLGTEIVECPEDEVRGVISVVAIGEGLNAT